MTSRYLFLDMETEGLDPHKDRILEVGWIFTDQTLEEILGYGSALVDIGGPPSMNYFVEQMHAKSGLLGALDEGPTYKLWEIENRITAMLDEFEEPGMLKPKLAGSGVHFDKRRVDDQMPNLSARLQYRILDSSQIHRFFQDICQIPEHEFQREDEPAHRAYADCEDSRMKMIEYRRMIARWRRPR